MSWIERDKKPLLNRYLSKIEKPQILKNKNVRLGLCGAKRSRTADLLSAIQERGGSERERAGRKHQISAISAGHGSLQESVGAHFVGLLLEDINDGWGLKRYSNALRPECRVRFTGQYQIARFGAKIADFDGSAERLISAYFRAFPDASMYT